jgi:Secretion system C-terminal sorting domain
MKLFLRILSSIFTVLLAMLFSTNGSAQTPRYFGMNVGGVADWEEARVFADAMKSARKWENITGGNATLDINGWPTGDATLIVHHGVDRFNGTYKLSFRGNGNVIATRATNVQIINKVYNANTNTTTADLIEPVNDANGLSLTFTGIAGGVKDVKLMRPLTPGSTQSYAVGTLFTNEYKAAIGRTDLIRTMDLSHTNTSDEDLWSERILPTHATYYRTRDTYTTPTNGQYKNKSCPWEIIVALANETNKDLWICVPLKADDNYVQQLANLIKNGANGYPGLNPNLKLYIEYSNELWNTAPAFQQAVQNWNLAKDEVAAGNSNLNYDGETNTWFWAWRRIGKRTREIANVFKNTFGAGQMLTRIRPVLCWQQGAEQNTARSIFTYLENAYPTEKISDYIFGGGGSAYYSPNFNSTLTSSNIWSSAAMDVSTWKNIIKKDIAWTSGYGIQYLCYEGGTGFDKCNCPNDAVMQAAWAAPEHRQSIVAHQTAFDEMGGFMLGYFTIATYNAREWGFTENIFDLNTQKFNALLDIRAVSKSSLTHGNVAPGTFFPSDFSLTSGWGQPSAGNKLRLNANDYAGYPIRTNNTGIYQVQLEYQYASTGTQVELFLGSNSLGIFTLTANAENTLVVNLSNINLTANTLYGVRFKVKTGGVDMAKINLIALTCPTPTNATATINSQTTATIGWAVVAGASNYNVQYRVNGSNTWTTTTTNNNSLSLTGLMTGTTYQYQIATNCTNGITSDYTPIGTFTTQAPPSPSANALITFENLPVGGTGLATYADATGYTFEDFGFSSNPLAVSGTPQGYASKCLRNENFERGIRLRKTDNSPFNLLSLDYAGDPWGGLADAVITGFFSNGSTATVTISRSNKAYATQTFSWTHLTKVEIDYRAGSTQNFGVIDNINLSDVTEIIDFENLTAGIQSSGTYADPKGFTFGHVNAPAELFQINGTAQGFSSNVLQNQNWNQRIRMTRTGGGQFELKSFDYASSLYNDAVDARVTGTFANGSTQQVTYTTNTKTLQKLTLNWAALTAVEIDFGWGTNAAFGSIDNVAVVKVPNTNARVGMAEKLEEPTVAVSVYPNPVTDRLYITRLANEEISSLKILNLTGQVIKNQQSTANNIEISNLTEGVYLLQVQFEDGKNVIRKFVKK